MAIKFERQSLYEEVWATPMTHLAKRYGLSDNGIRKVCEALNIPMPERGHWARVAAGHKLVRPPLPPGASQTTFVSRPPEPKREFQVEEDTSWLESRIELEEQSGMRVRVDMTPRHWHAAISGLRRDMIEEVRTLPKMKRDAERAKKDYRVMMQPGFLHGWTSFDHGGQILGLTHHSMPMRVSVRSYERALAIANALCLTAQARGFEVELDEKEGRFLFRGYGGEIRARISERLDEALRKEIDSNGKARDEKYKEPSGVLRLYIGRSWHEREFSDGKVPLEERLNDIFVRMYQEVVRCREERREEEDRKRRWEEERRQEEQRERERRQIEAKREAERKRRAGLVEEARAWQMAKLIRDYIAAQAGVGNRGSEWAEWAESVADDMDPIKRRGKS